MARTARCCEGAEPGAGSTQQRAVRLALAHHRAREQREPLPPCCSPRPLFPLHPGTGDTGTCSPLQGPEPLRPACSPELMNLQLQLILQDTDSSLLFVLPLLPFLSVASHSTASSFGFVAPVNLPTKDSRGREERADPSAFTHLLVSPFVGLQWRGAST